MAKIGEGGSWRGRDAHEGDSCSSSYGCGSGQLLRATRFRGTNGWQLVPGAWTIMAATTLMVLAMALDHGGWGGSANSLDDSPFQPMDRTAPHTRQRLLVPGAGTRTITIDGPIDDGSVER